MKVTAITPTAGRRRLLPRAIRSFLEQTYTDSELLIVDDGEYPVADLLPSDPRIRYFRAGGRGGMNIGELRNLACLHSRGDFICHFDDDDVSLPTRIADQMEFYISAGDADIVGYHSMLFHDSRPAAHALLSYSAGGPGYAIGTSLFYRRDFCMRQPFESRAVGEDNHFQAMARTRTQCGLDPVRLIARIHTITNSFKPAAADIKAGKFAPVWAFVDNPDLLKKVEKILL